MEKDTTMGRAAKVRGNSFEYRVRNWFNKQVGWNSERNPLSGASEQIKDTVAKHDVRAWHAEKSIFLQIECKKRGKSKDAKRGQQIEVMREWIDKIDFSKDELLVIGLDRSDLYAFIPTSVFFTLLGREYEIEYNKDNTYSGGSQFVFKLTDLNEEGLYHLHWNAKEFNEKYTIVPLDRFVLLRETAKIQLQLTFEDKVMRATMEHLKDLEKTENLTYRQKRLLYQKFEELESGHIINPMAHAQSQFWLDDAFVCICPHCETTINKSDFKKKEET